MKQSKPKRVAPSAIDSDVSSTELKWTTQAAVSQQPMTAIAMSAKLKVSKNLATSLSGDATHSLRIYTGTLCSPLWTAIFTSR